MNAAEFTEKIRNSEVDIVEHVHKIVEKCRRINHDYNYFNTISEELAIHQAEEIKGKIFFLKKNFLELRFLSKTASALKEWRALREARF